MDFFGHYPLGDESWGYLVPADRVPVPGVSGMLLGTIDIHAVCRVSFLTHQVTLGEK